jgi:hypothetical protein
MATTRPTMGDIPSHTKLKLNTHEQGPGAGRGDGYLSTGSLHVHYIHFVSLPSFATR